MSGRSEILAAVVALVGGVSALSTAGQVMRGIPDVTNLQSGVSAYVDCVLVTGEDDDQLGSFRRVATVKIVAATPSAAGVPARDTAIDTLLDAIVAALEADRVLSAVTSVPIVRILISSVDVVHGTEIGEALSLMAFGEITLIVEYITTSGTGI